MSKQRDMLIGAIAQGWCHPNTLDRVMDTELALAIAEEVTKLLPLEDQAFYHDDKGGSEEQCTRCGWTMGRPPLNCNNDNTPHVFPSQLPTAPADYRPNYTVTVSGETSAGPGSSEYFNVEEETAGALLQRMGTDAQKWAREWCKIAHDIDLDPTRGSVFDEDWMIGWFANAIETGRTAGETRPTEAYLGLATTRAILLELGERMQTTQNSNAGRQLGLMCRDAVENLDEGVLNCVGLTDV